MRQKITRHSSYFVYMLRCADGTYYTGFTHDLEARVTLHNAGHGAKSLKWKGKLPVELVYAKGYKYYKRAFNTEKWLKGRSRREKTELIRAYRIAKKMASLASLMGVAPQDLSSPAETTNLNRGAIHTFGDY